MAARKQYPLRIDPALWAELEAWAADELRSVNGQIEYLLRQAVIRRPRQSQAEDGGAERFQEHVGGPSHMAGLLTSVLARLTPDLQNPIHLCEGSVRHS